MDPSKHYINTVRINKTISSKFHRKLYLFIFTLYNLLRHTIYAAFLTEHLNVLYIIEIISTIDALHGIDTLST